MVKDDIKKALSLKGSIIHTRQVNFWVNDTHEKGESGRSLN